MKEIGGEVLEIPYTKGIESDKLLENSKTNFTNIIKRATTMLKYAGIRKPIINTIEEVSETKIKIEQYNNDLVANEQKQKYQILKVK